MEESNITPTPKDVSSKSENTFVPITSQEQLTKVIGERIAKVKNQFSNYDELKQKADELETMQAKFSDVQKELENTKVQKLKLEILSKEGLSDWIELIPASDEEGIKKQVELIKQKITPKKENQELLLPLDGKGQDKVSKPTNAQLFANAVFGT
jgi:predicted lipid-binding transport protein (Tim44 family)